MLYYVYFTAKKKKKPQPELKKKKSVVCVCVYLPIWVYFCVLCWGVEENSGHSFLKNKRRKKKPL